jgi:hypothetical protein
MSARIAKANRRSRAVRRCSASRLTRSLTVFRAYSWPPIQRASVDYSAGQAGDLCGCHAIVSWRSGVVGTLRRGARHGVAARRGLLLPAPGRRRDLPAGPSGLGRFAAGLLAVYAERWGPAGSSLLSASFDVGERMTPSGLTWNFSPRACSPPCWRMNSLALSVRCFRGIDELMPVWSVRETCWRQWARVQSRPTNQSAPATQERPGASPTGMLSARSARYPSHRCVPASPERTSGSTDHKETHHSKDAP